MQIDIIVHDTLDEHKKLILENNPITNAHYNMITLGKMSYISASKWALEGIGECHALIGGYTSIGYDVYFDIAQNHAYDEISTYPFDDIFKIGNDFRVHRGRYNKQQLIIGNDVWIGAGVRIIKAVTIGNGAIIGAGSIVTKDIPPYAVVCGNPAKIIRYRFPDDVIKKLQQIQWWKWSREKIIANALLMRNPNAFIEKFYTPALQTRVRTELTGSLESLRNEGNQLIYFVPDWGVEPSVWQSVIDQYLKKYTAVDKMIMVLDLSKIADYPMDKEILENIFSNINDDSANILSYQGEDEYSEEILHNVDYFVTTRECISIDCVDSILLADGRVISGLEVDVFSQIKEV